MINKCANGIGAGCNSKYALLHALWKCREKSMKLGYEHGQI